MKKQYKKKAIKKALKQSYLSLVDRRFKGASYACPPKLYVKLPYHQVFDYSAQASPIQMSMRSSIYDPETAISAGGHNVMYYDNWQYIYGNYRVHKMSGKITVMNLNFATPIVVLSATTFDNNNSGNTGGTVEGQFEQGQQFKKKPITRYIGWVSGGNDTAVLPFKTTCHKSLGFTDEQYRVDDNTKSAFGTNPNQLVYQNLAVSTESAAEITCRIIWDMVYFVEFLDPIRDTASDV